MPRMVADVWNGRLLRFVIVCALAYAAAALILDAPIFILGLTAFAISSSAGVCIAYAPVFSGAMLASRPTRGDFLGAGIFLVAANVLARCVLSVIARDLGWPGIYNTDWMSGALAVGAVGSLLHLWAPHAVEGRIPPPRWVSTAVVVAVGAGVGFLTWSWHIHAGHPAVTLR